MITSVLSLRANCAVGKGEGGDIRTVRKTVGSKTMMSFADQLVEILHLESTEQNQGLYVLGTT